MDVSRFVVSFSRNVVVGDVGVVVVNVVDS